MGGLESLDLPSTQTPHEANFPSREWMPDTTALNQYLKAPRWYERVAKWKLRDFKKENSNPDGTPKYRYTATFSRSNPPHRGHIFAIEAALAVTDEKGKVVIGLGIGTGKADVNKRDKNNPLTALQREMIIRKELTERGISPDRYRFLYVNDYGDPQKWGRTIVNQLKAEGITLDAVVNRNQSVTSVFENLEMQPGEYITIPTLRPPKIWRGRFRGETVREKLRASDDLRPFGK